MLEDAIHQYAGLVAENHFGAVAMVDIRVDDCHALQVVILQYVTCGHGHVAEGARTHRAARLGMMAGQTDATESIFRFVCDDPVGGIYRHAGGQHCDHIDVWVH